MHRCLTVPAPTLRLLVHCFTVSAPLLRAWIHFPRAPEQFVTSPLCLVGYVRWDARSDRVPPLQTIIFSSFPGRTKGCRPLANWVGLRTQVGFAVIRSATRSC